MLNPERLEDACRPPTSSSRTSPPARRPAPAPPDWSWADAAAATWDVYERALSNTQYGPYWGSYLERDARGFLPELWQSLRSLWHYHHDVYAFHTGFLNDSTHVYQSKPWGWLLLNRPVGVNVENDIQPGEQGCEAAEGSHCLREVLLIVAAEVVHETAQRHRTVSFEDRGAFELRMAQRAQQRQRVG